MRVKLISARVVPRMRAKWGIERNPMDGICVRVCLRRVAWAAHMFATCNVYA